MARIAVHSTFGLFSTFPRPSGVLPIVSEGRGGGGVRNSAQKFQAKVGSLWTRWLGFCLQGTLNNCLRKWGLMDEYSMIQDGPDSYLIPKPREEYGVEPEGLDLRVVIQQQLHQRATTGAQQQGDGDLQVEPHGVDLRRQLEQQRQQRAGGGGQQQQQEGGVLGAVQGQAGLQQQQQEEVVGALQPAGPSGALQLLQSLMLHEQLREQQGGQPQEGQQGQQGGDGSALGAVGSGAAAHGDGGDATGGRPSVWERLQLAEGAQQQQQQQHGDPPNAMVEGDAELAGLAADEGVQGGLGQLQGSTQLHHHQQQQGGHASRSLTPDEQIDADMRESEALFSSLAAEAEEVEKHTAERSGLAQQHQQHVGGQSREGLGDGETYRPERPPAHLVEQLRRNILGQMRGPGSKVALEAAADPRQLCPPELKNFKPVSRATTGPRLRCSLMMLCCLHVCVLVESFEFSSDHSCKR